MALASNLNNEMKNEKDSKIAKTIQDNENSYFLISNFIQEDVADKIKMFLKQEKLNMQERIKRFSSEQEKQYKDLFQSTLNNKHSFLRMIEAIKIRHNIDNIDENKFLNSGHDNNKENRNNVRQRRSIDDRFLQDKNSIQFDDVNYNNNNNIVNRSQKIDLSSSTMNTVGKNPDEFDSIFDIDDLDVSNQFGGSSMESVDVSQRNNSNDDDDLQVGVEFDDDLHEERRDNVFPLKESNTYSSVLNNKTSNIMFDEFFSSSASDHHQNLQKFSSSLASHNHHHIQQQQQKNGRKFYRGHSDDHDDYSSQHYPSQHQIASSLPIQIPHFARRNEREMDEESFRINPGESMADSIQKMARSVRNEVDIIDDRPRRRLNTGDLIKSRPFFN
ncbi:hypothetical protein BLA29_005670 [Euroglyphus maynei]|uniref:Uncharacterized protein n=1 Tax=Euroglyphus maynei TaxID=6958 RepID=A0A1Y3BGX2_EURMA|nr:hypothetical protein BLA29_005670 [Euroglyphus maynei]